VNIFYLDHDVTKCAEMHNDKHTVKMILEYCQLLSTAHRYLDGLEVIGKTKTGRNAKRWILNDERNDILYSATHIHHPSAVWCRKNAANYEWLHKLLVALCKEYTYRYGKIHKCQSTGLVDALGQLPNSIAKEQFTQPTPAMPDEVKIAGDSVASYRNYYINNKTHLANWKNREVPSWYANI
jgi:hypothetical protein